MIETAEFLSLVKNKTIIIVDAIMSLSINLIEGAFNIGTAFSAVQYLPHGVYIAMNAKVFNYTDVKKK